jgi:hypothetical protein
MLPLACSAKVLVAEVGAQLLRAELELWEVELLPWPQVLEPWLLCEPWLLWVPWLLWEPEPKVPLCELLSCEDVLLWLLELGLEELLPYVLLELGVDVLLPHPPCIPLEPEPEELACCINTQLTSTSFPVKVSADAKPARPKRHIVPSVITFFIRDPPLFSAAV